MSTPALIMWAVVFAVGFPASLWNPTAGALVVAKLAGTFFWLVTGDSLPVEFYPFTDIFIIAVIMAKHEYCNQRPYRNTLHQLRCVLMERSPADRVILLIFPLMWVTYVAPIHPYYAWWLLWGLAITQFLAAGLESFSIYRRGLRAASDTPDNRSELLVAYGGRGYG